MLLFSLAAIAEPWGALSPMEKAAMESLLGGFLFCFLDFVIEKFHCFHHLGDATPQIKQIVKKSRTWLFVLRKEGPVEIQKDIKYITIQF